MFDTHSFICHRRHKTVAIVSVKTHNSAVLVSVNHLVYVFEEAALEEASYEPLTWH